MLIEIRDKSFLMIFLLEECNFSCSHCVREGEPMEPGYRLTFEQLRRCISDLGKLESVKYTEHSGGETTLWREGDLGLTDVLIEEARAGYSPRFTTNGSLFLEYDLCYEFFQRYFTTVNIPLRVAISTDTFHGNFDTEKGRCLSLDNIIRYWDNMPSYKRDLLGITPMAVVSKDPDSLLPEEMLDYYKARGAQFTITPLRSAGRGKTLTHLCPDLSSGKKEDLGAYYPYRPEQPLKKRTGAQNMVLIGDAYYLPEPRWHIIARLGQIPEEIITAYSN